ncbi:hypothetical protein ONE63_003522 [Megalurothrips usitatus]|uniref:DDE Tnp4 domain-containing protein n=1 Tax=Megalurothrips usitatus TaxID=439358 RepID=A0AAV7X7H7_9NEOP|nr:hypothetical protein ONE63_003522 [Megalurothrips usitatus]
MKAVFTYVSEYMKVKNANSALSPFEEFAMVMMRLRLNLIEDDLADRFNVSQGTVSKIINSWLLVMAKCLSGLIVWPDRETLKSSMPMCFRKAFGTSVTVILDCFEIFVQRPSNLKARAQTWSSYKHHNTVKYLIGITPQGTVSFISSGWGGRTSDKFVTEAASTGFFDKLNPGDVIMADRGFNIGETSGIHQARVLMPAFMNGRSQLSATDVEETREIARVRIHVERVIGLLRRKFHILSDILSLSALQPQKTEDRSRIDQIVVICCALCNLCPPIVPLDDDGPRSG